MASDASRRGEEDAAARAGWSENVWSDAAAASHAAACDGAANGAVSSHGAAWDGPAKGAAGATPCDGRPKVVAGRGRGAGLASAAGGREESAAGGVHGLVAVDAGTPRRSQAPQAASRAAGAAIRALPLPERRPDRARVP
jgi:hypothetical protein